MRLTRFYKMSYTGQKYPRWITSRQNSSSRFNTLYSGERMKLPLYICMYTKLNHCFEGPRFKKVEKILKKSWIGTRRSMPRHSNMSPTQYTTLISRTFTGCLFWELFNVHVQWNAAFRWIIGYKNLLRACEFSGRAGILGLEYISSDEFSNAKFEQFLQADVLRREYLNQTFNFLPFLWVNKKKLN